MKLVEFNPKKHYETICEWWKEQDWPCVPADHLPLGFLVMDGETPACAGFLYLTGTAMCHFEWIVANPEVRGKKRAEALNFLISSVKGIARDAGCASIFMATKHPNLISRLEKQGFIATDYNVTNLLARV